MTEAAEVGSEQVRGRRLRPSTDLGRHSSQGRAVRIGVEVIDPVVQPLREVVKRAIDCRLLAGLPEPFQGAA